MTTRPFRFGVQASSAGGADGWVDLARRCEELGYATLTMPDHYDDQLAPIPALMAAAAATSTLRVGALVLDNDYKHPAVLAKELATIDVLSGGRLDIGLGAGWMESDYTALGIDFDLPRVRVDRFTEGLEIIRRCMSGERFSFSGSHYTITDYTPTPAAVQSPCPPILIGGGGRRVLGIAARQADIVGINATLDAGRIGAEAFATMTPEAVDAKVDIVRAAAGERLADIELNVRVFLVNVTNDAADTAAGVEAVAGMLGVDEAMIRDTPFALIGTAGTIVDKLGAMRDRWGFSYVIVGAADVGPMSPVVAELTGS
jgi:probable F420-dependent oxidoreductase